MPVRPDPGSSISILFPFIHSFWDGFTVAITLHWLSMFNKSFNTSPTVVIFKARDFVCTEDRSGFAWSTLWYRSHETHESKLFLPTVVRPTSYKCCNYRQKMLWSKVWGLFLVCSSSSMRKRLQWTLEILLRWTLKHISKLCKVPSRSFLDSPESPFWKVTISKKHQHQTWKQTGPV